MDIWSRVMAGGVGRGTSSQAPSLYIKQHHERRVWPLGCCIFFWTEHLVGHTGLSIIWSASTMALKYKMFILALHAKNASPYCRPVASFYPWGLFYFGRKLVHIDTLGEEGVLKQ